MKRRILEVSRSIKRAHGDAKPMRSKAVIRLARNNAAAAAGV